jgi:hypothetical protein
VGERPILFSAPMVRALLDGRKTQTRRIAKVPAIMGGKVAITSPDESLIELDDGEFRRGVFHYASTGALSGPYSLPIAAGDRLWVRETWAHYQTVNHVLRSHGGAFSEVSDGLAGYRADGHDTIEDFRDHVRLMSGCDLEAVEINGNKWRPSIFMPRWASRLTLTVTDVRVQRLLEISEEDAVAEGIRFTDFGMYQPPGEMSVDGGKTFHKFKPRQHDGWHWQETANPGECLGSASSAYCNLWNHINGDGSATANPWVAAYTFTVEHRNIDEGRVKHADANSNDGVSP